MFCDNCGAAVASDSKFCNSCGKALELPVTGGQPTTVLNPAKHLGRRWRRLPVIIKVGVGLLLMAVGGFTLRFLRSQNAAWPMFDGDAQRTRQTRHSTSHNVGHLAWTYSTNRPVEGGQFSDEPDKSVLVGFDGTLYFAVPGKFIALNGDGSFRWESALRYPLPLQWALDDDRIYVSSTGADYDTNWKRTSIGYIAELQALSLQGKLLWVKKFDVIGDLVIGSGRTLYAVAGPLDQSRTLYAFSRSGAVQWIRQEW